VSVPFRSVAIEFASSGGSRNWTNSKGKQPAEAIQIDRRLKDIVHGE